MAFKLNFGHRVFTPAPALTAVLFATAAGFIALGGWQWRLGNTREAQFKRFEEGADRVLALGSAPLSAVPEYQRVALTGRFDGAHQFLLDNSVHHGVDGYQVLTPLDRAGAHTVLVDRGWVPFTGNRARLPDVALEQEGPVTVTGRVGQLPAAGLSIGHAPPPPGSRWPKVTSFPRVAELSAALGRPVESRVLLLDPVEPGGYIRDWKLPGMPALENWGYAFQWWALATASLIIWVVLSTRRRSP